MRTESFRSYFEELPDADDRARGVRLVREQLEGASRRWYFDESGDGTRYVVNGCRHGVGFARATVEVLPNGSAQVTVRTGQRVDPSYERGLRKLFSLYSSLFKVRGFEVEEGRVIFRTRPFDPETFRFDVDRVVALGFSSVHAYAGVTLALDAGVEPWELMEYDGAPGGPESGDDEGESQEGASRDGALSDLAREVRERLARMGAADERTATE